MNRRQFLTDVSVGVVATAAAPLLALVPAPVVPSPLDLDEIRRTYLEPAMQSIVDAADRAYLRAFSMAGLPTCS